ncbi:MAG: isocitrate lyase [Gammaproteobacteria bacterium]|nr:isocitrate lyase [Gammaproteobacteria bacterium]
MPYSINNEKCRAEQINALSDAWANDPRWTNVDRGYTAEDVVRLRGTFQVEHTIARRGAERLWTQIENARPDGFIQCSGAQSPGQAVQQAKNGVEAIYLSARGSKSIASDFKGTNTAAEAVQRINGAFKRADEIQWSRGTDFSDENFVDYFLPIVADSEPALGSVLNAHEIMKSMIGAGAAGVHFADHLSGSRSKDDSATVLVPTSEAVQKLVSARLAADVLGVPAMILARTTADSASLVTSDVDPNDATFVTGERTEDGFYRVKNGLEQSIARGLAYAQYADLVWVDTGKLDMGFAREFAKAIHEKYPSKPLAYNCSTLVSDMDESKSLAMRKELALLGYHYQFINANVLSMSMEQASRSEAA